MQLDTPFKPHLITLFSRCINSLFSTISKNTTFFCVIFINNFIKNKSFLLICNISIRYGCKIVAVLFGICTIVQYISNTNKRQYCHNNLKINIMKITKEIKRIASETAKQMPLGTFTRLKVNGIISDIVIQPSSSGVYFFNVKGTIGEDILEHFMCFKYYSVLM